MSLSPTGVFFQLPSNQRDGTFDANIFDVYNRMKLKLNYLVLSSFSVLNWRVQNWMHYNEWKCNRQSFSKNNYKDVLKRIYRRGLSPTLTLYNRTCLNISGTFHYTQSFGTVFNTYWMLLSEYFEYNTVASIFRIELRDKLRCYAICKGCYGYLKRLVESSWTICAVERGWGLDAERGGEFYVFNI